MRELITWIEDEIYNWDPDEFWDALDLEGTGLDRDRHRDKFRDVFNKRVNELLDQMRQEDFMDGM